MGDVAASGGYYIACAAGAIVAHPEYAREDPTEASLERKGFVDSPHTSGYCKALNKHSDFGNMYRAVGKEEGEVVQSPSKMFTGI